MAAIGACPSMLIVTPSWTSRFASVVMSARCGKLARVSVSEVSRLAAISGSAAFLAPLTGMLPCNVLPPRMRILSMESACLMT